RRTYRRADTARHARAPRSAEPVSFLPGLQAVVRRAAPPLSQRSSHRPRQDAIGAAHVLGHRDRADARLQRDEFVHGALSQGNRFDTDRVSPKPRIARETAMTRRLIAIATAIFVTSGCAYAQVGGMGTAVASCLGRRQFLATLAAARQPLGL